MVWPTLFPMATVPDLTLEAGLPANIDAEKTILGAILLDNAAHAEAAEILKADDFSLDSHRRIFLRMSELVDSGRAVDIVTLANELARYKEVEAVGGVAYLASLTEGLPRRPVIEEYIRIVKDKSLLRRLMGICSAAIAKRRRPERRRHRSSRRDRITTARSQRGGPYARPAAHRHHRSRLLRLDRQPLQAKP